MPDDMISELINRASEALRESIPLASTPESPRDLYHRAANILDLLAKLGMVVGRLDQTLTIVAQLWELGSDDDVPAAEHVSAASVALQQAKVALDRAYARASKAHSALAHVTTG
jgi:hypothetical protein